MDSFFIVGSKKQYVHRWIVLVLQSEAGSVDELDGVFVLQDVRDGSSYWIRGTEPISHHIGQLFLGERIHRLELAILFGMI